MRPLTKAEASVHATVTWSAFSSTVVGLPISSTRYDVYSCSGSYCSVHTLTNGMGIDSTETGIAAISQNVSAAAAFDSSPALRTNARTAFDCSPALRTNARAAFDRGRRAR